VLLGDGVRFYSSPGLARIDLEPLDSTQAGAVTILRFRVRKLVIGVVLRPGVRSATGEPDPGH
jgi:hypothetical protein